MTGPIRLAGVGASPGVAVGAAFPIDRRHVTGPHRHVPAAEIPAEIARLHDAVQRADEQLAEIRGKLAAQPQEHGLIIEAHRLMLSDPELLGGVEQLIRDDRINAEWAVRRTVDRIRQRFEEIDDPYFRDRRNDVEFVGERILKNLLNETQAAFEPPPPGAVVVARDLSPADTLMLLSGRSIAGIVTDEGGRTSHTAIVARALGVPAVLAAAGASGLVGKDDEVALDGGAGVVVLNPGDEERRVFVGLRDRWQRQEQEALATRDLESRTQDGHRVGLYANVELVEEVPGALAHGADGIGLYRTEFLYLDRRSLPTEDEHLRTYRRLLEAMPGRPVTVRTLDLGGEKVMPSKARHEPNPTLGLRALRFCLAHPEIFRAQLRALWRASPHGNLRVMFPLVSGLGELREAKRLFYAARDEVVAEGHKVADDIPLGIMIETPAAALLADELAREVSFFALGTNDLIQYTLAIDRRNPDVSYLYNPAHPALLRLIEHVVKSARASGVSVSVCGEMAGDPAYTLLLVALGLEELSMSGASIPTVKRIIRASTHADALELLQRARTQETPEDLERFVREEMARRFPDLVSAG